MAKYNTISASDSFGFLKQVAGFESDLQVSRIIDDGDVDDSFDPKMEMAASQHLAS